MDRADFLEEEIKRLHVDNDFEGALQLLEDETVNAKTIEDVHAQIYNLADALKEMAENNDERKQSAVGLIEKIIFVTPTLQYQLRLHDLIEAMGGIEVMHRLLQAGVKQESNSIVCNIMVFSFDHLFRENIPLAIDFLDECYSVFKHSPDVCSSLMESYAKSGSPLAKQRIEDIYQASDKERVQEYYDKAQRTLREIVSNDREEIISELNKLATKEINFDKNRDRYLANEDRVINLIYALGNNPDEEIIAPITGAIYKYGGKFAVIAAAEVIYSIGTDAAREALLKIKDDFLYDELFEMLD